LLANVTYRTNRPTRRFRQRSQTEPNRFWWSAQWLEGNASGAGLGVDVLWTLHP
jgi:hypothetical protein